MKKWMLFIAGLPLPLAACSTCGLSFPWQFEVVAAARPVAWGILGASALIGPILWICGVRIRDTGKIPRGFRHFGTVILGALWIFGGLIGGALPDSFGSVLIGYLFIIPNQLALLGLLLAEASVGILTVLLLVAVYGYFYLIAGLLRYELYWRSAKPAPAMEAQEDTNETAESER